MLVCSIFRDYPSDFGHAEFKDCAVFIHKGDDICLFIAWFRTRCRPHMLFDHVTFYIRDISEHDSVFYSDVRVAAAVVRLTLQTFRIVGLAVIIEKVVHKTGSCCGTCIKLQTAANEIAVIRNVEAVLETGRIDMMFYRFELCELRRIYNIADAGIVCAF